MPESKPVAAPDAFGSVSIRRQRAVVLEGARASRRPPSGLRLLAAVVTLSAVMLSGCARASTDAPQAAVTGLLELRSENSTDPAAYASFVTTPVAQVLAEDSAAREGDVAPLPEWDAPEVVQESTSTAEVKVEWVRSKEHSAWPETTTFILQRIDGSWLIIDAIDEAPADAPSGEDPP